MTPVNGKKHKFEIKIKHEKFGADWAMYLRITKI